MKGSIQWRFRVWLYDLLIRTAVSIAPDEYFESPLEEMLRRGQERFQIGEKRRTK